MGTPGVFLRIHGGHPWDWNNRVQQGPAVVYGYCIDEHSNQNRKLK